MNKVTSEEYKSKLDKIQKKLPKKEENESVQSIKERLAKLKMQTENEMR